MLWSGRMLNREIIIPEIIGIITKNKFIIDKIE